MIAELRKTSGRPVRVRTYLQNLESDFENYVACSSVDVSGQPPAFVLLRFIERQTNMSVQSLVGFQILKSLLTLCEQWAKIETRGGAIADAGICLLTKQSLESLIYNLPHYYCNSNTSEVIDYLKLGCGKLTSCSDGGVPLFCQCADIWGYLANTLAALEIEQK